MKLVRCAALAAALVAAAGIAIAADTMIVKKMHQDAIPAAQQPAKDYEQTTWIGDGKLRMEGGQNFLVRLDQKKAYLIDADAKKAYAVDLPVDFKKLVPPEQAALLQQLEAMKLTVTVTPTEETKKIGQWTVKRYNMTASNPMMKMDSVMWVTKDVAIDFQQLKDMTTPLLGLSPGTAEMVKELQKIDGYAVTSETTMTMAGSPIKMTEETVSVTKKDPPAGTYEVPEGYTVEPLNFMTLMMQQQKR